MNTQATNGNENDPTGESTQRRLQPQGEAQGGASSQRHREEVVGQGSGETAGGSPATAKGDNIAAQRSADEAATAFDPAILSGGGGLSNTPPPKTTLGGEDYLTVNFYLEYESFGSIRQQLEKAKERSIRGSLDNLIQLGEVVGVVSAGGARVGTGEKSAYVPWRIATDHGITLLVSDRMTPHKTQPSVQISAPSLPLMRLGFANVWGLFQYLVEKLGGRIVANKLSRVDPCLDLPGTPVTAFSGPFELGWFVTRARKRRRHEEGLTAGRHADGRRDTGFSVGKSPLGLRVYDKLIEAMRNPVKLEVLVTSRWLGLPESATRIEFQLRRGRLKRLGIDTVEDWIAKRADIVDHLMTNWFRLTSGPVDRQHADRAITHPHWQAARDLFAECYGAPVGADLSPLPSLAIDPSQRLNVAIGVLKTAITEFGYPIETNHDFLAVVVDLIDAMITDRNMADEITRRAIEKGLGGFGL